MEKNFGNEKINKTNEIVQNNFKTDILNNKGSEKDMYFDKKWCFKNNLMLFIFEIYCSDNTRSMIYTEKQQEICDIVA